MLKRSIMVALRYPIFGKRLGNFHHKSEQELGTHNAYTQVAAETGIAAMVFYIIFLVHPLRKLRMIERDMYERNDNSRFYYLAIGLQASLVAYMAASFSPPLLTSGTLITSWPMRSRCAAFTTSRKRRN